MTCLLAFSLVLLPFFVVVVGFFPDLLISLVNSVMFVMVLFAVCTPGREKSRLEDT